MAAVKAGLHNSRETRARARVTESREQKLELQRIVVPSDFSGFARQALLWAVPLARKYRAKIHLVHVVQSPVALRALPDGSIAFPVNTGRLVQQARLQLSKLAVTLLPEELRGEPVVCEGNPAHEVVSVAKALPADLIVLSTKGRSGLPRVFLGSTAERIVRHAHCPVLTVRRQPWVAATQLRLKDTPDYAKQFPWRHILVGLDFSLTSLRALRTAVVLARQSGAPLSLLNVIEPSPYPTGMEGAVMTLPEAALEHHAQAYLLRVARRFVPRGVRTDCLVRLGRPASVIADTAEEKRVDLIVLSTHGHSALERLLIGGTAEQVVRHAKCPVLVVRWCKTWEHRRGNQTSLKPATRKET